jgi:hypothetical protein
MSKLYEIVGGNVSTQEIPKAGVELKVSRRMNFRQPIALDGIEDAEWSSYTLGVVAAIASQMSPWAKWYCSPRRNDDTGKTGTSSGWAHIVQGVGWLSSETAAAKAVSYALHEVMHLAEDFLTAAEMAALNAGILGVPDLPAGDWNAYYTAAIEVRANSYEAWAYSYWLRGRTPQYYRGMPADERIWTMIYRGDLGLRVARRGLIPADYMNPALRQRLDKRTDSQMVFDAVRRAAVGTWKLAKATWTCGVDAWRTDPGVQTAPAKRLAK